MAATPIPAPTMPITPSGPEGLPTAVATAELPSGNGAKPATPEAQVRAAAIQTGQENGVTPHDALKNLASEQPAEQAIPPVTPPEGSVAAAPDAAASAPITTTAESETTTTTQPTLEKPEDTNKINNLLRDAVNHLVSRHDERFVMVASAMAASPQTHLGSELRKNALITLRDLEPHKGLWRIFDKKSLELNNAASGFVEKADQPSSAALVAFLSNQRDSLDPEVRDNLLPLELLRKVRTGEAQAPDIMAHFSNDKRPMLQTVADNLHHEATGRPDGRMPTLYDPREMLKAAGVDTLWNRLQIKQMTHPEQYNIKANLTRYGPIVFILFMSALQMFPQDQKQQATGH